MRTWPSIAIALTVATTLQAYANDRTSMPSVEGGNTPGVGSGMSSEQRARSDGDTQGHDAHGSSSAAAVEELKNITTEKFFREAAAAGTKEVQAAELALRNGKSDRVKTFARDMISDHTKQNSRLTTLAAQNDVQVPRDLPEKDKADIEKLRTTTGATFDTTFAQQMQMDHAKAVALFQACANSSKVAKDVQAFCRENVATLQEHSRDARGLDTGAGSTRAASADE